MTPTAREVSHSTMNVPAFTHNQGPHAERGHHDEVPVAVPASGIWEGGHFRRAGRSRRFARDGCGPPRIAE